MELKDYVFLNQELKDTLVIDTHIHVGGSTRYQKPDNDATSVVKTMDHLGVNITCASCSPGTYCDFVYGNEMAGAAHAKYPERILAYASVNPNYEIDLDDYFVRDDRFFGIKAIPFVQGNKRIDCEGMQRYYEYADKKGLPVLFHAWQTQEIQDAYAVAKRYPNAKFIFGHSGFVHKEGKEAAIEAVKNCDNVMLDTTLSDVCDGALEWIADQVGTDRLVYGTDLTAFECAHILGRILMSKLSDTDKEKILGLNAKVFLGL